MTKVQIVMPAINLWKKYTLPAIESVEAAMVYAQKHGIECRFVLVDNASTDETKVEAGKRVGERFSHKRNEDRWGFQRSVNYGVNDAWERGMDYALILNNDVLLHPQAIWRLVEGFENPRYLFLKNGGVVMASAEQAEDAPEEEYLTVGMVTAMDVRGETTPVGFFQMSAESKADVLPAPHPNFSAFMLDRRTWEEVGEMDELFAPAYFEDNDYHYRMKLLDFVAIVYPPALFYHFGSGTQNEANENKLPIVPGPLFENNRASYARKWGGVPGQEKYEHPYNDFMRDVTSVQQKI